MNAHRGEPKALFLSPNGNTLFKCRMWLWLVVPGLHDAEPTKLLHQNPTDADLTPPAPLPYEGMGEQYSPLLAGEGLGERFF